MTRPIFISCHWGFWAGEWGAAVTTNADVTVYNACTDPKTRLDSYRRTVIRGVWFYVDNKVAVDADGLNAADVYKVRVPASADTGGAEFVQPWEYTGKEGTWTLKADDYVVRGVWDKEIERPADLQKWKMPAFRINSWADNRFGGLPHWRIGGA